MTAAPSKEDLNIRYFGAELATPYAMRFLIGIQKNTGMMPKEIYII